VAGVQINIFGIMEKETVQVIAQIAVPFLTALCGALFTYLITLRKQKRIDRENLNQFQQHMQVIVISIMACNGFGERFRELYYQNLEINHLTPKVKTVDSQ
jgi:hypothetical protein